MNDPAVKPIRRIVTGHDAHGRSVVAEDGPVPNIYRLEVVDVVFQEMWNTQQTPCVVDDGPDPTPGPVVLPPPPNGTRFRIIDIPPDSSELLAQQSTAMRDVFSRIGDAAASTASTASRHPAMHRTESIDYGVVLDGAITLLLDEGEVDLKAGDVVIQRGTNHAWANRSDRPCRMLFVLIGGRFAAGSTVDSVSRP